MGEIDPEVGVLLKKSVNSTQREILYISLVCIRILTNQKQ